MSFKPRAIETRYKGYRFRSRLEARWAVFFDSLGINWEYEKEGYDLGDAGYYLPDFFLPKFNVWAEVKPSYESKSPLEAINDGLALGIKAVKLLEQTDGGFIYLQGMPQNAPYEITFLDQNRFPYHVTVCFHVHDTGWFYDLRHGNVDITKFNDVERAVIAAKSARFEHGEHGA